MSVGKGQTTAIQSQLTDLGWCLEDSGAGSAWNDNASGGHSGLIKLVL